MPPIFIDKLIIFFKVNRNELVFQNTVAYQIARCDSHLSTSSQPLHFVQRLDYATSGVLCMAKSRPAAASAGKAFEKRLTRKYYLAIVRGHVGFELADVDYGVGKFMVFLATIKYSSSHILLVLGQSCVM